MNISPEQLQNIIEAALMVAGRPLNVSAIQKLFEENDEPSTQEIRAAIEQLKTRYSEGGIELQEVASGFQFQAKKEFSNWLCKLWEERPPRYSRAFLETLSLIAYRQPITRGEIEEIRGVTVNSQIIKTLMEREWIKIIGHREVVGRPAIFGTTKTFLDHFNLKSLDELPTLAELKDLEMQEAKLQVQLELSETENIPAELTEEAAQLEPTENQVETEVAAAIATASGVETVGIEIAEIEANEIEIGTTETGEDEITDVETKELEITATESESTNPTNNNAVTAQEESELPNE